SHRDADTWSTRLRALIDRGFQPKATIADGGQGLRAGDQAVLPAVPCRGNVWHALHEITPLVRSLDNRAYQAITACDKLKGQLARPGKRRRQCKRQWTTRLWRAEAAARQA